MRTRCRSAGCWRALLESPLLFAVWLATVLACIAVHEVAGALRRAEVVRGAATTALARVAAETAAVRRLPMESARGNVTVAGIDVHMEKCADSWLLTSVAGGESFAFRAAELPGRAPTVFARGCSVVEPKLVPRSAGMCRIAADELPRIDDVALERAARAERTTLLRRDRGIALLTWENGTERDDFVFDAKATAPLDSSGDVLVVPGHLWIEAAAEPLRIQLQKDLTLVVSGNVYVGRSIVVHGGRLVVVAMHEPGTPVFADTDGNGRWSAGDELRTDGVRPGPPEGTGNVFFGLPGSAGELRIDAAFVATGELHLRATAHVAGPMVIPFGVTVPRNTTARLVPEARWTFAIERERVPAFRTSGEPRLGLLVPCSPRANDPAQQALYLSSPAR